MKLDIDNIFSKSSIATYGFFIVYPFFVFYHTLISYEIIKPIFGSLLGLASLFIVLAFLVNSLNLKHIKCSKINFFEVLVWAFYIYCFLWALISYTLYSYKWYVVASFYQVVAYLGVSLCLYLIGKNICLEKIKYINMFGLLSFLVFLFFYTLITGSFNFMPNRIGGAEEVVATYQAFSGIALVMGFIALVTVNNNLGKLSILLFVSIIIFYLGSRSELIGFIIGGVSYLSLYTGIKHKMQFAVIAIILIISYIFLDFSLESISTSRVFELNDVSSSSSWSVRQDLNHVGVQQVIDSPFFGFFGGHAYYFGSTGAYAHNIISSWVSFGVIGFVIYFSLILSPFTYSIYSLLSNNYHSDKNKLIFMLSLVCFILCIISKSVYWTTPAFLWGLMVNRNEIR